MKKVLGIRFKKAGKIYYFDPEDLNVSVGDDVIVETVRGIEYGTCVISDKEVDEESLVAPLKPVIRVADELDKKINIDNKQKAKDAIDICRIKAAEHGLDMKLVDAEFTFDNNKVLFYFTADGRIDFRDLVKDLAQIFRTRIELRQIGVRDQAKVLGAVGQCGRCCCCNKFLGEFTPVSIKMAKDQCLSLNPCKISGVCGRLMCCLKYEHDCYEELIKKMPKVGTIVQTDEGRGVVIEVYLIQEQLKVLLKDGDEVEELKIFALEDVKVTEERDMKYYKESEESENLDYTYED